MKWNLDAVKPEVILRQFIDLYSSAYNFDHFLLYEMSWKKKKSASSMVLETFIRVRFSNGFNLDCFFIAKLMFSAYFVHK